MRKISIKVCGLKDPSNVAQVACLEPDYMGFILSARSPRYVSLEDAINLVRHIPGSISTVGVLVNEPIENALEIAGSGAFNFLQLHGDESVEYCEKLNHHIDVIKVFSISGSLPEVIKNYQPFCRMFLFDTAGVLYGGNGNKFDHRALADYSLDKDFILSGGISPEDPSYIKSIGIPSMTGVDLNSRFEMKPGIKDIDLLKKFIDNIRA